MGRKRKKTVDWFSHYIGGDQQLIKLLKRKFNIVGYGVYYHLMEELGRSEGHYLDLSNPVSVEDLALEFGCEESDIIDVCDFLASRERIDTELWARKIVWCDLFIESLEIFYKKREDKPAKPFFRVGNGNNRAEMAITARKKPETEEKAPEIDISDAETPHNTIQYNNTTIHTRVRGDLSSKNFGDGYTTDIAPAFAEMMKLGFPISKRGTTEQAFYDMVRLVATEQSMKQNEAAALIIQRGRSYIAWKERNAENKCYLHTFLLEREYEIDWSDNPDRKTAGQGGPSLQERWKRASGQERSQLAEQLRRDGFAAIVTYTGQGSRQTIGWKPSTAKPDALELKRKTGSIVVFYLDNTYLPDEIRQAPDVE